MDLSTQVKPNTLMTIRLLSVNGLPPATLQLPASAKVTELKRAICEKAGVRAAHTLIFASLHLLHLLKATTDADHAAWSSACARLNGTCVLAGLSGFPDVCCMVPAQNILSPVRHLRLREEVVLCCKYDAPIQSTKIPASPH